MNCILAHRRDPDRPRAAAEGALLCHGHLAGLAEMLAAAPGLSAELLAAHSRPAPPGERVGGTPSPGLRIDPAVLDARATLAAVLSGWCRVVTEDRGLAPVADAGMAAVAGRLLAHLGWAAAQPWVDEMHSEVAAATAAGRRLAHPSGTRRFAVGACPGCGGELRARISEDGLLPAEVACAACAASWPPSEWLRRLGPAIAADRAAWLSPPEAAAALGVSVGHVRVLAHRGGWASRPQPGGRVAYARADVEGSR